MLNKLKLIILKLKANKAYLVYALIIVILTLVFASMLYIKFSHKLQNILTAEQNKQLIVYDLKTQKQIPASEIIKSPTSNKSITPAKVEKLAVKPAEISFIISLPNSERSLVEKAITLPREFIISFSPSSDQSLELSKLAKDAGHETVVQMPISGGDNIWGNLNLSIENSDFKNQKNFEAAMSKVFELSAVILPANEHFSESNNFTPILRQIAKSKLYLISESDQDTINTKAKDNDVDLVKVDAILDKPEDLPSQFTTLEELAKKYNYILVVFESPNAENIDAINKWQAGLKAKNITLTASH